VRKVIFFFSVKVTVKFIRRGMGEEKKEIFPVPHTGNGSKDSGKSDS
jgi:hypothetical protein